MIKILLELLYYYWQLRVNYFSVRRNVGLAFKLEEFFARQALTRSIAMTLIGQRLPEIVQATGPAAVNGSRDLGQRSDFDIIV